MRSLILGLPVGRSVGKEKKGKKWRSLELGGLVLQHNNMREQRKKRWQNIDCIEIMCNYLLYNFFLENAKTWVGRMTLNGRKRGIALGDKKITPRPQTRTLDKQVTGEN